MMSNKFYFIKSIRVRQTELLPVKTFFYSIKSLNFPLLGKLKTYFLTCHPKNTVFIVYFEYT